ncbi:UPF0606 protein KIAA1549L homolog isoform X1 [Lepus europaeus]|uniref:UPF0606 protein KIAA1549L homolog isoform X1 n=1 Tax=Lepus europaeus TaxID=9983 RepID=UPI002B486A95|nr:UPF0606 protein KIAA1549L homolog isoform X1 [Lepus europaeus]
MALQAAKPRSPSDAGPAAPGRRGRSRARGGLGGAGAGAARCPAVRGPGPTRGPGAGASQDAPAPPLLLRLLLGLLLLAALAEHSRADPGADNLRIKVTPTPESFPHGKWLPISPTRPFSEAESSPAVDRMKNMQGPSPHNTSLLQPAWTPSPRPPRRTRAHVDFSSSLYQGSGHSASLEPLKDSTESLVQPRPRGGREAADVSGLPRTSMPPTLSRVLPVALSTGLPTQPPRAGTPSLSTRPLRADLHSPPPPTPPSSSPLAPDSPPPISFSKQPTEQSPQVPPFPRTAPADSPVSQSIANPLNLFSDEVNQNPSPKTQDFKGIPHVGSSGFSTKQYSELSPAEGPPSAGSPTPLAPESPPRLPRGTPSRSVWEAAPSPASTQPISTNVVKRGHHGVPLPTLKNTAATTREAEPPFFQIAEAVAVDMTGSRELAPASAEEGSANLPGLSATPESSGTSSSPVPSAPFTPPGQGRAALSGAVPASSGAKHRAPPPPVPEMPAPQEDKDGSPPAVATDVLHSSRRPDLLSGTWAVPLQKQHSTAGLFRESERTSVTFPFQALPSTEVPSRLPVTGFTSDFSPDRISSPVLTTPRASLFPSASPPASTHSMHTSQPEASSPGFPHARPETYALAVAHSELPASAPKQVTAFSSSTDTYGFSTMGDREKPAVTDVLWSSLSAGTGSLSKEPGLPGLHQQTNYDLSGHTINSPSWESHPVSTNSPSGSTLAITARRFQHFKDIAGRWVTTESPTILDLVFGSSLNQLKSDVTMVGSNTYTWPTNSNSHSRNFQVAEVEYYPVSWQQSGSHSHLQPPAQPTHSSFQPSPSLTSTATLQEIFSDGTDTGSQISISPSPVINAFTSSFQSVLRYHLTAESPLSTSAFSRTSFKVPRASQHPRKWTVDFSVSSNVEPTTAATTLFLRKSSTQAMSAALVARGTSGSGLAKSSLTTVPAKNVTNKAASGPKVVPGAVHTAFPFTPTYMMSRTAHTVSTQPAMQGNPGTASGLLSTTHLPRKSQAMHTGLPNPANPEVPRVSTPRPLTVTAALASGTAPVKATRWPPSPAENTDAVLPAVSTAVVTIGKMASNLECQMSRKLLVKTVLFVTPRRAQTSESLKLTVAKGLTQALRKAFRQSDVVAHVDILEHTHNVTVGYYATKGRLVYLPAVVMQMLGVYGISNVTADLKQHTQNLQSVAVLASPWIPQPAGYFQLKTVLQFVSPSDNIQSCKFAQTMEQRLQKAFQDAESKVLNTKSNLTVQVVSTSNASQAVTLLYVVGNQSTFLNGTVASSLLSQLSAELVGFYLTYPPLTIAEPLEYPNLDISETTRDYWVITVLQGVDNSLVGLHNQSFARVMEQRLAQLFMMSQQQGRRFKRATTLGSYTVQMVKMQRVPGPKDPAELTYYTLYNGKPLLGTAAAKILSTIDSQRMALTLHHVVLLQADPVVKNPPNNLWIIAAVLAPIAVVTVIIIIITAVLCRKNKNDFKADTMINLPQRAKPVQGFDYAKQHLGQQGADEEVIPVTQETVVLPLPTRDAPQERDIAQDGSTIKTAKSTETRKSRSPSENGSVISNESGKPSSGRRSPQNVMAQQKVTKEEARKRNVPGSEEEEATGLFESSGKAAVDPFDTSSGSVQLIAIKPAALPVAQPPADRSQESSAVLNGEVNKALKQKSDIEHYRNKLRLKAKRKGYYDFPPVEANKGLTERKKMYEKGPKEIEHVLEPDPELCAPFAEPKNRQHMKNSVYRSRQSLNSPSPGETEMDLLVTRERPRRGIRNSGYDTEPEIIEETNVDRVHEPRGYARSRQVKGHSETSTLSSQPSIDEVRQQMHMLLEEAFSLASAGHASQSRHQDAYGSAQHLPYSEVVTSAPGTMTRPRAGVQWVPTYRPEMYQYSLPRPAYRFSQLPEMVMGSPPPPVPPRTGPVAVASLRRSTSDIGSKSRMAESVGPEPAQLHDSASFTQVSRGPVSVAQLDQSALNYSGNTVPAVFAIPAANRPGFTGYFIPTPPSSYRNQAWMSYAGESELPSQWADSVPLPGYIEAYPRSRYQQGSPSRLPRQYSQPAGMHPSLEQAPAPSTAASQQSLAENDPPDAPLTNISTAALVKAIREEVAKLAKKQTDMFEFQV